MIVAALGVAKVTRVARRRQRQHLEHPFGRCNKIYISTFLPFFLPAQQVTPEIFRNFLLSVAKLHCDLQQTQSCAHLRPSQRAPLLICCHQNVQGLALLFLDCIFNVPLPERFGFGNMAELGQQLDYVAELFNLGQQEVVRNQTGHPVP